MSAPIADARPDATPYPRCKRESSGDYSKLFAGKQRRSIYADEHGAVCVIEPVFSSERLVLMPIENDSKHVRIVTLNAVIELPNR